MKTYTVKITGSGTFKQISSALLSIAYEVSMIADTNGEPGISDIKWEDPTLMTEITEEYSTNPADVDASAAAYTANVDASAAINRKYNTLNR